MRATATKAFYPEMILLEASLGPINWIYADSKSLPTTGIGSLLGSKAALNDAALDMPWRRKDGHWASRAEKQAEWVRLRDAGIKGSGYAYQTAAKLFLAQSDVQIDFDDRAASKEAAVAAFIPNWPTLPADAQLAAMSMAWNVGENMFNPSSSAYWPNLTAALQGEDFGRAAENCLINGTPSERNRRNRILFYQSARIKQFHLERDSLRGPIVELSASALGRAKSDRVNATAWWAQLMLRIDGAKIVLDGLWGNQSKAVFAAAGGDLTKLSARTLRCQVTA